VILKYLRPVNGPLIKIGNGTIDKVPNISGLRFLKQNIGSRLLHFKPLLKSPFLKAWRPFKLRSFNLLYKPLKDKENMRGVTCAASALSLPCRGNLHPHTRHPPYIARSKR
jgi:hypothetical protein